MIKFLLVCLLLIPSLSYSERLYKCKDAKGNITYSDTQCHGTISVVNVNSKIGDDEVDRAKQRHNQNMNSIVDRAIENKNYSELNSFNLTPGQQRRIAQAKREQQRENERNEEIARKKMEEIMRYMDERHRDEQIQKAIQAARNAEAAANDAAAVARRSR